MKNIFNEKPTDKLSSRSLFNTTFVEDEDIKNKDILDIGCGFGWFELNVLKRGCKSIRGIEKSNKELKTAIKYLKNEKVKFSEMSGLDLKFEEKSFDTVVAWEVIEHLPKNSEVRMFKEVNRILKRGGVFYLSTPYKSLLSNLFDPAWWTIGHRHYSINQLKKFGEEVGFKIEEYYICGKYWSLLNILNLYISKWIFRRRPFLENSLNKLENKEFNKDKRGFVGIFIKYKKNEK